MPAQVEEPTNQLHPRWFEQVSESSSWLHVVRVPVHELVHAHPDCAEHVPDERNVLHSAGVPEQLVAVGVP